MVLIQEKLDAQTPVSQAQRDLLRQPTDFSLVLGGPLFKLLKKSRLIGDDEQLLHRRIAVSIAFRCCSSFYSAGT
jgi:hypothetical protein